MAYVCLVVAMALNAVANILLKEGASTSSNVDSSLFKILLTTWQIPLGLFLFASNVVLYFIALRDLPISLAYPVMVAGGFIVVHTYAAVFFQEQISVVQVVGYSFILIGIALALGVGKGV